MAEKHAIENPPVLGSGKPRKNVALRLLLALVLVGGGIALLRQSGSWVGWVALVAGLLTAISGLGSGKAKAMCPVCGRPLISVGSGFRRCGDCDQYFQVFGKDVLVVTPATKAPRAIFAVKLQALKAPSEWVWPVGSLDRCCVCGEPADRLRKLTVPHRGLWDIQVPYCGLCTRGIEIGPDYSGGIKEIESGEQAVKFTSYGLYRAFRDLNRR